MSIIICFLSGLDLNSSASDLLRDYVGALPPFAFIANSVLPIQTASAQGDMPLEKYRRLRLCRAVGALPYTAAIPEVFPVMMMVRRLDRAVAKS